MGYVRRPHSGAPAATRRPSSGHRWGTVGRHADKAGEIEGVLLHTLKHRVKYVFPSCSATQREKLEEFLTHIQVSGDPTDEDGQLGRVLYVGALIKNEGEGNCGMIVLMCGETIPSETLYGGLE